MLNQTTIADHLNGKPIRQALTLVVAAVALNVAACQIALAQFDLGSSFGSEMGSGVGSDMGSFGLFTQAGFPVDSGAITGADGLTGSLGQTQLPSEVGVIVEPDPPWTVQNPNQIGDTNMSPESTTNPVGQINFDSPTLNQWDLGSSQILAPSGGGQSSTGGQSGSPYTKAQYNISGPPTRPSGSDFKSAQVQGQNLSTGGGGTVPIQTICPY